MARSTMPNRDKRRIELLFRAINRMSVEESPSADLSSELRSSGVDPEQLVATVRRRLATVRERDTLGTTKEAKAFSLPLINQLRRLTNLSPQNIARRLDVPLAFLSAIERHLDAIPAPWREELAKRIKRTLQIDEDLAFTLLQSNSKLEFANLNQSPANQRITPEYLLDMSDMDQRSRQFWLDLARTR
jgi:DNA-binding transcriptional regulator YiaG